MDPSAHHHPHQQPLPPQSPTRTKLNQVEDDDSIHINSQQEQENYHHNNQPSTHTATTNSRHQPILTTTTTINTPRLPYQESESDSSSPKLRASTLVQSPLPLTPPTECRPAASFSQALKITTNPTDPSAPTLDRTATTILPEDNRPFNLSPPPHQHTPFATTNPSNNSAVNTLPHPHPPQSSADHHSHCSRTPSPCNPRVQLPSRDQSALKLQRKPAPLSSSTRSKSLVCRSSLSTATSEVEHGFTTDEDTDRTPVFTGLVVHSLIGAPMPAVHELLGHHPQLHPSERSSPSRFDHLSSSNNNNNDDHPPAPIATPDQYSSSSRLSRPSKLSDENLQRQSQTGLKERVKKSIKMRETERWARETATSSQQPGSPNPPTHSNSFSISPVIHPAQIPHPPSESDDRHLASFVSLSPIQFTSNVHSSPSPETLPRPRISVQPVPSFRAVATTEPNGELTIISEHASINDWHSENTNTTHLAGPSQQHHHHHHRTLLHLSPVDVQVIGQTPTSADFQSPVNNCMPPTVLPGTVIGGIDLPKDSPHPHILPIPLSPFSHPPSDSQPFSQSPRIQEIPLTPPTKTHQSITDPLIRARINLQEALSATPQARSTSNSPSDSPVRQYHPQHFTQAYQPNFADGQSSDEDNDSGLSPIKEDRTAEMAAEHSWRIRQVLSPPGSSHRSVNRSNPQLSLSKTDIDHADPYTQVSTSSHPHTTKSENSTASIDPDQTQNSINPPTSHSPTQFVEHGRNTQKPVQTTVTAQDTSYAGHQRAEANDSLGCSQSINDEQTSLRTISNSALSSDDVVLPSSQHPSSSQPQQSHTVSVPAPSHHPSAPAAPPPTQINPRPSTESITSRRQASPLSVRTGIVTKSNPPLSLPASARRPLPVDLLNRLEMEEWRNQTGIDDRHSLSLRSASSPLLGRSLTMNNGGTDIDRGSLVGVGGEERRGIKDRWGNSWGLESHVLSPLSERTERSLTTVGSLVSLSTRKSTHSLRSLDSTSNSLAQRLEQADTSSVRLMKLGSSLVPTGVIRTGASTSSSNQMARSMSCPLNRIDSPTKSSPLNKSEFHGSKEPPHLLLEEKMKRKEERRIKREKREKRRAEELKSSESLAQKQERRRQEKKRKEEFLEKKQQILLRLQEDGENPQLVRDLGILYLTSNVGIAGLKLAIRHLETSLQINDTDALAWSSLGKAWSKLHGVPEAELAKLPDPRETTKSQQAHNATIGLRKAIINSRTHADALKYKVEWARYLEKLGRWRDSLGVIGEIIKNEGKLQPKCWAGLGFVGLRLVFGWAPLENLETDDLEQGFIEGETPKMNEGTTQAEKLSDPDRMKLLSQVHHAFERALALIDDQIGSATLQAHNPASAKGKTPASVDDHLHQEINRLKTYKLHYQFQLTKLDAIEKEMMGGQLGLDVAQTSAASGDRPSNDPPIPGSSSDNRLASLTQPVTDSRKAEGFDNFKNAISDVQDQSEPVINATQVAPTKDPDIVTEEIRECPSSSSSPAQSYVPVCQDPEPTNYVDVNGNSSSQSRNISNDQPRDMVTTPVTQNDRYQEIAGGDYLEMATPTSQIDRSKPLPPENYDMRTPSSQVEFQRDMIFGAALSMAPMTFNQQHRSTYNPLGGSASSDGPEVIVQYDDVDTTNDYSDSRNSDPFRPSSSLGHHLVRSAVSFNHNPPPHSSGSHETPAYPAPSATQDSTRSLSPVGPSGQSLQNSFIDTKADDVVEKAGKMKSEATGLARTRPSTASDGPVIASSSSSSSHDHPHHQSAAHVSSVEGQLDHPIHAKHSRSNSRSSSASSDHHHPPFTNQISTHALVDGLKELDHSSQKTSSSHHLPSSSHFKPSPSQLPHACSDPLIDHSLFHAHSKVELGKLLDGDLKELDKQKVIAFLELDSDYHSKVSKLRKKLMQIEEEREVKRKEMFMKLGLIKKNGYDQERQGGELNEMISPREEEEEEGGAGGGSIIEEGRRMSGSVSRQERQMSSFSSVPSAVSMTHPPHHHQPHHQRDYSGRSHQAFHETPMLSRSLGSPPSPHQSSHHHRAGTFELDHHHHHLPLLPLFSQPPQQQQQQLNSAVDAAAASLGSAECTLIGPSQGAHGQANIALQGIAAILKLASSSSSSSAPPPLPMNPNPNHNPGGGAGASSHHRLRQAAASQDGRLSNPLSHPDSSE
ncbi:hypothetical protein PGT21_020670 [Puccinia graminis f. sp. tritici]|uniref:Uncharacterized protein n=1 Tax=Puccinia graminis f. sp. tritici TaxID=56615 RepID=A0A5B0NCL5_PUCGR|nr:hypothetical protein PGT21_020670 [Puccinia graminis f. sp. tritici]KAA1112140.1 hypothetical protein PGTUg99_008141 [Puccinia graminis f. sp. tritici]